MKTSQTHRKHNKKVTPKSSKSLAELCAEYREIREKHGNQAASSEWMIKNGYGRIVGMARLKFELPWNEFKKKAGFDDSPLQKLDQSLSDLINDYAAIRSKYGNQAASSKWMMRNGYSRIVGMAHRKFKLSWNEFIAICSASYQLPEESMSFDVHLVEGAREN